jgi:DNA polymerase I-like protein with 3'-5' exonuclease and polymerase domains
MTIYDELDGSFDPGCRKANAALQEIKRIMETCEETLIPMRVDDGTGKNWDAAKG